MMGGQREEMYQAFLKARSYMNTEDRWEAWCAAWSARAGQDPSEFDVNRMPVENAAAEHTLVKPVGWSVAEWWDKNGCDGRPDAVVLMLQLPFVTRVLSLIAEVEGKESPKDPQTVMRFKSAAAVDDLVEALLMRRNGVWPHMPGRFRKA